MNRPRGLTFASFSALLFVLAVACSSTDRPAVPRPGSAGVPTAHGLRLPVDGVRIDLLADSFGAPRSGGRRHEGIDIMAPRHTPVRSTTDGVVSHRGPSRLGGKTVSIRDASGYRHYYAHLERWARIEEGARVRRGEVIGYVGNSGNASGGPTHLHYAIYDSEGRAINPFPLLLLGPGGFR